MEDNPDDLFNVAMLIDELKVRKMGVVSAFASFFRVLGRKALFLDERVGMWGVPL